MFSGNLQLQLTVHSSVVTHVMLNMSVKLYVTKAQMLFLVKVNTIVMMLVLFTVTDVTLTDSELLRNWCMLKIVLFLCSLLIIKGKK